jgi:protein required for attachment to host cells
VNALCIVVADGARARLYFVEPDGPRKGGRLIERAALAQPGLRALGTSVTGRARTETNTNRQAGPVHPMGAQRERHRLDIERRFAAGITETAAGLVDDWADGTVVLIAEPRMLGLLRETVRGVLKPGIAVKELARDFTGLTAAELYDRLVRNGVIRAAAAPNGPR